MVELLSGSKIWQQRSKANETATGPSLHGTPRRETQLSVQAKCPFRPSASACQLSSTQLHGPAGWPPKPQRVPGSSTVGFTELSVLWFVEEYMWQAVLNTRAITIVGLLNLVVLAYSQVPAGFYVISRDGGLTVYKKDWAVPGGVPDYVTVAKLDSGAAFGNISTTTSGPPHYNVQNTFFANYVASAVNANSQQRYAVTVTNGTFYNSWWTPLTQISFGLKHGGSLYSPGVPRDLERLGNLVKLLRISQNGSASVSGYSSTVLGNPAYPTIIGLLSKDAYQDDELYRPRNMFGLRDGDGNGTLDTIVFFFTEKARKADVIDALVAFGCNSATICLLDAGGSAAHWINGVYVRNTTRIMPHAVALYASQPWNNSNFVADVTIPDGTILAPGAQFVKKWRMRNSGNTTWGEGYHWTFDGGSQMGGPTVVATSPVNPNATWDPMVTLVAPSAPGTYRGYWRTRGPSGTKFGTRVWVEIVVANNSTIFVHDEGPEFTRYGPSQYWWRVNNVGLNGMWYTYTNGSTVSNYAHWRPNLPTTRRYRVEAMIPENHATTRSAKYQIYHRYGQATTTVNQSQYFREWVSLGTFDFLAGTSGYIKLTDVTGEAYGAYKIGFDSIRFIPQ